MAIIEPEFGPDGLRILTVDEIRSNLRERISTSGELGAGVSTGDHTYAGMMIDIMAPALSDLYELLQEIYDAWDYDAAEGVQLDNLAGLKGIDRDGARASTIDQQRFFGAGTVPQGALVGVSAEGPTFSVDEELIVPASPGYADVSVTAVETGPTAAAVGAVETLISGIGGITGTTNLTAAVPGKDVDTDSELRAKGESASQGSTTEAAIYTALVDRDDIDHAVVTSNRTGEVDEHGTPPRSYWIVIYPDTGNQQEIAETIWGAVGTAAGIGFRGEDVEATVTDANGIKQRLAWDWADTVDVHVAVELDVDDNYPLDGDDLAKAAIAAYGTTLIVGQRVDPSKISASYNSGVVGLADAVPGIAEDEVFLKLGEAPGPSDTDPVSVAVDELPRIQATNVDVTSTPLP